MALPIQTARIVKLIDKAVESVAVEITLDFTRFVIEDTPVDTGWARANWIPSVGSPVESPAGFPGEVQQSFQQQGVDNVGRYSLSDGPLYVSNNVPYIEKLNAGTSSKAPAGFVETDLDRAVQGQDGRKFI